MRRVDLLKTQLTSSRGRFFTANYKSQTGLMLKLNFKVTELIELTQNHIKAEMYIPSLSKTQVMKFNIGKKGDLQYLSADRSRISMSGLGLIK
jgi:hypothetical protein